METELWPNMISALHARKIPLVIANARLSERSAKGYGKLGKFMRRLLSKITLIAAQNRRRSALYLAWPETQPAGGDRQPEIRYLRHA